MGAVLSPIGCNDREGGRSRQGSTLSVFYMGDEQALGLPYDMSPKFLVFLPLVTEDAEGRLVGRLARSWEHSPDWREWTVHLRTDVRWHDGTPVTAHDVEFTLDLLKHPAVAYADPEGYEVQVLDDSTFTIRHRVRRYNMVAPPVGTPRDGWTVYYPKHLLQALDPAQWQQWEFWKQPVGNGPYRYVRHLPQTMIELEANPDFYLGRPGVERVLLRFGGQPLVELLAGNVDAIPYANQADLPKVEHDPRFRLYQAFEEVNVRAVVWNRENPLLADANVRRALTQAVDRAELARLLHFPEGTPLFDVPYTPDQFRRRELPPALPYDPGAAARLFDATGWEDTNGGGMRERDGSMCRFSLLVAPEFGLERTAVYLQSQLQAVGVRMDIETLELGAVVARVRAADFDAALLQMPMSGEWAGRSFFDQETPDPASRRIRALLQEAREAMDPVEQDRVLRESWPVFQAQLPVLFLSPLVRTTIAHRRVQGLSTPYRVDPVVHMEEIRLVPQGGF